MANTYVDIEDKYELQTTNDSIVVDVLIGNAQSGAYSIFLGMELISQNSEANLGTVDALRGKELMVSCVVKDTREETNWTSMTIGITEGSRDNFKYGPYSRQVKKDLDTVTYTIIIAMI